MGKQVLDALLGMCMAEYQRKRQGRLQGRHCKARLLRGKAKRIAAGKAVFTP